MNADNAKLFLAALGTEGELRNDEWMVASCPLAFARHKGGKDTSPSFGIRINDTGKSGYNCYSCQIKGPTLDGLLTEMHYYALTHSAPMPKGIDLAKAYKIAEAENEMGYFGAEWHGIAPTEKTFEAWPDWFLESYPAAAGVPEARAYLASRSVPESLWHHFKLRYDPKRKMIGFPFWNRDGQLAGMRGRDIRRDSKFPHYDFKYNTVNNTSLVWLGEHAVDYLKPVVLVEGQFDYARVYSVYRNVLCNLTASLSAAKVDKLENAVEIVGFFDDDEAGAIASALLEDRFKGIYRAVDWTPMIKYRVNPDDLGDPGDCNQLQIAELLKPYVSLDTRIK